MLLLSSFGPRLLPKRDADVADAVRRVDLLGSWSFFDNIEEAMIEESSPLVGLKRSEAELIDNFGVHVVAVRLGVVGMTTDPRAQRGVARHHLPDLVESLPRERKQTR